VYNDFPNALYLVLQTVRVKVFGAKGCKLKLPRGALGVYFMNYTHTPTHST
jgi:hypothetical protein